MNDSQLDPEPGGSGDEAGHRRADGDRPDAAGDVRVAGGGQGAEAAARGDDPGREPSGAGENAARVLLVAAPFLLASVVLLLLRLIG